MQSTLLDRHERLWFRSGVIRRGPDQPIVRALFQDVRRPPGRTRDDKNRREEWCRDAAKAIGHGAEEIEIGENLFLAPHHPFNAFGNRKQISILVISCQFTGQFLDGSSAWVTGLIDA